MNEQSIAIQAEIAKTKLREKAKQFSYEEKSTFQGLLFVGNRHETVPLRLLTDPYLTPRAKTAWQMIKLNAHQFQGSVFPSYNELALWLSDRAFQGKLLSRKVVSQTLLLLRLTRWLTLCETVRNERGQVLGNVYVMNDEPLSLSDCIQLSDDYLRLLEKSARHQDPLVQDVATAIIDDILRPEAQLWHFVSHIEVIRQRYQQSKSALPTAVQKVSLSENLAKAMAKTEQKLLSSNKELSQNHQELSQKMNDLPSSNRELSSQNRDKSLILGLVPKWNSAQYSTSTDHIKSTSTVLDDLDLTTLKGLKLSQIEMQQISVSLQTLDSETRQAVLFEVQERLVTQEIHKPAGYLFSVIQRAKSGNFKPYMQSKAQQNDIGSTVNQPKLSSRLVQTTPRTSGVNKQARQDLLAQMVHLVRK